MPDSQAVTVVTQQSAAAERFMPVMALQQAVMRYNAVLEFTQQIMKSGKDFGTIPGVDKPSLLKPGAEKLCSFFGLTPRFETVKNLEDWTGDEPFFYYWYKCQLWRGDSLIAEGDGSCNSRESKYRYRWVGEDQLPAHLSKKSLVSRGGKMSEFEFAIDKSETAGKYGKPAAYWQAFKDAIASGSAQKVDKKIRDGGTRPAWEIESTVWRVPNPDVSDQVNTIQKIAQKRSLVAATLIACNASEYYTQDIEDMDILESHGVSAAPPAAQPLVKPPASRGSAPPAPGPVAQPSTLDQILGAFTKKSNIASAFDQLKEHFLKVLDRGVWDQILLEHACDGAREFGTVGNAKKCFTAAWTALQREMEAGGAAEPPISEELEGM